MAPPRLRPAPPPPRHHAAQDRPHLGRAAGDPALVAFVPGPNASFVATSNGDPAMGVELGYAAMGWAQRSGNHRLTAFSAARARARLGESRPCLDFRILAASVSRYTLGTRTAITWYAGGTEQPKRSLRPGRLYPIGSSIPRTDSTA